MKTRIYLDSFLGPLRSYLDQKDVTDIWINRPGEVWIETASGRIECSNEPLLTDQALDRLARQVASFSHQGFNREQPLLSASLPDGSRIQVIGPPATREGFAVAIRRHNLSDIPLGALSESGLFDAIETDASQRAGDELQALLDKRDFNGFLKTAVRQRKTILLSGGTSSGKTTLLNALIKEIPQAERLVVIEDAPEVRLIHANAVGLIATRGGEGEAQVDVEDLLQASLRMRPDRIMLGELRGKEAFSFLRAVNTGHPGSITTLHADSPAGAIDQIALLSLMNGARLDWNTITSYVRRVIEVIVQMRRVGGERRVVEVVYNRLG
mgnify:CR=1 FL=1